MKTKIPSMFAALAILILVVSLVPFGSPMAKAEVPGVLRWDPVAVPTTTDNVLRIPTAVGANYSLAVAGDGKTIYVIDSRTGAAGCPRVYRSDNAGETFRDMTPAALLDAATDVIRAIAVSPDDPLFVAIGGYESTLARQAVYISNDGGANWGETVFAAANAEEVITCIDVARTIPGGPLGKIINIAVGTVNPWPGVPYYGRIYRLEVGGLVTGWVDTSTYTGGFTEDITSLKFSPTFPADRSLVAIGSNAARTALHGGNWGSSPGYNAAGGIFSGWPVTIQYPPGAGSPRDVGNPNDPIVTSDIALPSDFFGMESASRIVFVVVDSNNLPAAFINDCYRFNNTVVRRLDVNAGAHVQLRSVAYHGTLTEGKITVGYNPGYADGHSVNVRRAADPLVSFPTWLDAGRRPSGETDAFLRFSPDGKKLFVATTDTGPDREAAFGVSDTDGVAFQEEALIDTSQNRLDDVEPSIDGSTVYLSYYNGSGLQRVSVFRSKAPVHGTTGGWSRMAVLNIGTTDRLILRASPEKPDGSVVYAFKENAARLWYTRNAGKTWSSRISNATDFQDAAVEDNKTVYILDGTTNAVSKTTDTGWTWETPVDSRVTAFSIKVALDKDLKAIKGKLLVGGTGGAVSYSLDGAKSFTPIPVALPVGGNVSVVADKDFDKVGTPGYMMFYAASDFVPDPGETNFIYRWVIGVSTSWETIRTFTISGVRPVYSALLQHCGALYGVWHNNTAAPSAAERSLNPWADVAAPISWDRMDIGASGYIFNQVPQGAKICDGVVVWAIDTTGTDRLVAYTDTLSKARPTLKEPTDGKLVSIDPVTGRAGNVTLIWDRLSLGTIYEIQISRDADFTQRLWIIPSYAPPSPLRPALIVGPTGTPVIILGTAVPTFINLEAGKTYYWRVRVRDETTGDAIRSLWSTPRSFTVETGVPVVAPYLGPQIFEPAIGAVGVAQRPALSWSHEPGTVAKEYEIVIAEDPELVKKVDGTPKKVKTTSYKVGIYLDWGKTYFWQVKATDPVGNPSPVAHFTVMEMPPPPPPPPPPPVTPGWVWVVIAIGALLVIVTLILIVRTGRRV